MIQPPDTVFAIEESRLGRSCNACGADNDGVRALVIGTVESTTATSLCLPCRRRCAEVLAASCVPSLAIGCEVELCTQEPRSAIWKLMSGSRLVEDQGSHRVFRTEDGEYRRVAHFLLRAAGRPA